MKNNIKKAYYLLEDIIVWTAINTFRFATGFIKQVYANNWRSPRLALRALLPVFVIWVFAMAGVGHRNRNLDYKQGLVKAYSYAPEYTLKVKVEQNVVDFICEKFGDNCIEALAVAYAESGVRCEAKQDWMNYDGSTDGGVFQINDVHARRFEDVNDRYDCGKNVEVAYEIHEEQGWRPWYGKGTPNYNAVVERLSNDR